MDPSSLDDMYSSKVADSYIHPAKVDVISFGFAGFPCIAHICSIDFPSSVYAIVSMQI